MLHRKVRAAKTITERAEHTGGNCLASDVQLNVTSAQPFAFSFAGGCLTRQRILHASALLMAPAARSFTLLDRACRAADWLPHRRPRDVSLGSVWTLSAADEKCGWRIVSGRLGTYHSSSFSMGERGSLHQLSPMKPC